VVGRLLLSSNSGDALPAFSSENTGKMWLFPLSVPKIQEKCGFPAFSSENSGKLWLFPPSVQKIQENCGSFRLQFRKYRKNVALPLSIPKIQEKYGSSAFNPEITGSTCLSSLSQNFNRLSLVCITFEALWNHRTKVLSLSFSLPLSLSVKLHNA
jgi:hypothetical protein